MSLYVKAGALDHNQTEQIDHLNSELNTCCLIKYITDSQTGKIWSPGPVFATTQQIKNLKEISVTSVHITELCVMLGATYERKIYS